MISWVIRCIRTLQNSHGPSWSRLFVLKAEFETAFGPGRLNDGKCHGKMHFQKSFASFAFISLQ